MTSSYSPPKCPGCSFTVFNRRYPRCERCGEPLPPSLVLTKDELRSALAKEQAEGERASKAARHGEADQSALSFTESSGDLGTDIGAPFLDGAGVLPNLDG